MIRTAAGLSLAVLLLPTSAAAQTIRMVDDDGQASTLSCDGAGSAYTNVPAAITAAVNGDTVLVCPGTYIANINVGGKAITIRSVSGPAVTVLDGNAAGSVVTFATNETRNALLEGFTIRNGVGSYDGGGILISNASPTVRRNVVVDNRACEAVGISISFGSPLIEENTVAYNRQGGCTGGTDGAGIAIGGSGSAIIRRNNIHHNSGTWLGGGISMFSAGTPIIEHNIIWENSAEEGGGIGMVNWSDAEIVGNVIFGNDAEKGGGVYWLVPSGLRGPRLVNNTIVDNDSPLGSGILADGFDIQTELHNNVIVAATGQIAVLCGDFNDQNPPQFRANNVFSATGPNYGGLCFDQTGSNGNISSDPQFRQPAAGDFHLLPGSPNIDAGSGTAPGLPAIDIDGHVRVLDGDASGAAAVDIGADEAPASAGSAPAAFVKSLPVDGAPELLTTVDLVWATSAGATDYEYCVDAIDNGICDSTWLPVWSSNAVAASQLQGGTTYYWQVRANNSAGVTYADNSSTAYRSFSTQSRIISLSGDMNFGNVLIGQRPTRTLTISNTGSAPLTVRSINYPNAFYGAWSGSIPAGGSQPVTVTFSPASTSSYGGDITVVADQTSGTAVIAVSGRGTVDATPPVVTITGPTTATTYTVNTASILISGTATDAIGVTQVTCANAAGGSVSAVIVPGSSVSWNCTLPLVRGSNAITVTARDAANNAATDTLAVTYPPAPTVTTSYATGFSGTEATLNGTVNPNGVTTSAYFDYGLTAGYGSVTGTTPLVGDVVLPLNVPVAGLACNTLYHYRIVGTSTAGISYGQDATFTTWPCGTPPTAVSDVNRDGAPDLVWQHETTRQVSVWYLGGTSGTQYNGWDWLNPDTVSGWRVRAVADFNGDGVLDLVWQHETTGQASVWYMGGRGGTAYQGWNWLSQLVIPDWKIVAAGDLNGDRHPDLVWQHETTRQVSVWFMGGAQGHEQQIGHGWAWLSSDAVPNWRIVGLADVNGDGARDLVWQHDTTRQVTVWYLGGLDGTTPQGWNWLNDQVVPNWSVVGLADLDKNGTPDLLWQHETTRQVTVWFMSGAAGNVYQDWAWIASSPVPGWMALAR